MILCSGVGGSSDIEEAGSIGSESLPTLMAIWCCGMKACQNKCRVAKFSFFISKHF
jgi:hypothetical protein